MKEKIEKRKSAAVVVLYHPSPALIDNIFSFCNYVEEIILYKNSSIDHKIKNKLIDSFGEKLTFLGDETNQGIGTALNKSLTKMQEKGYTWALTMDQDSKFLSYNYDSYERKRTAVIYPEYNLKGIKIKTKPPWIMTSGSLVNIEIWSTCNKFNETYFIDGVDFEFYMRVILNKYKIEKSKKMTLDHNLGDNISFRKILFLKYRVVSHPPIRQYYIYRNYIDISKEYIFKKPSWSLFIAWVLLFRYTKITLLPQKYKSLSKMARKGIKDSIKGKKGAYENN